MIAHNLTVMQHTGVCISAYTILNIAYDVILKYYKSTIAQTCHLCLNEA